MRKLQSRLQAGGSSTGEVKELGEIRSSQLITSYGVGAIVDFRDETAILAGADDWYDASPDSEKRVIHCHNLEKVLSRQFFVKPKCDKRQRPGYSHSYSHDIAAYRFPEMLYCPNCTRLCHASELNGRQKGELLCAYCSSRLVPSRFVVVCRRGHIDDFPYYEWVHKGEPCKKATDEIRHHLKLFSINGRMNLGSLMISCEDCKEIRSMQDAFIPDIFSAVYRCKGKRPWLEYDDAYCEDRAVVRMRTSTGVYMPVNIGALNIPPWSTRIYKILSNHSDAMDGKNESALLSYIHKKICPQLPGVSDREILDSYFRFISEKAQPSPSSPKELAEEEYRALQKETEDTESDFCTRNVELPLEYENLIASITAIDRLTETVAMLGFTRLQCWNGEVDSNALAPIFSKKQTEWLPGIEMHGEGFFIRFREDRVQEWEQKNAGVYESLLNRLPESGVHCENASPRYILLHTFSHLLIRSLAKRCGYQTSSLREKIYASYQDGEPMAGVLVYTATPDSDGSLGGLVAQADSKNIQEIIDDLLCEAEWCSGDPLCMVSTNENAQGLFGLNYAACHQCTLLPETSCVMRNVLLDRAALIGRRDDGTAGFFE